MSSPKILVWDIETGYNLARIFSLFNKHRPIPHSAIQKERYMISASFKELGKSKTYAFSLLDTPKLFKKDPTDDSELVKAVHEEISSADALIAHYGDNFDIKFFNTRALINGLPPAPPVLTIDTYKIAKQKFLFNNNRLDYIGKVLKVGGKISTSEGLWDRCYDGDPKAVKEMVVYNKQDVNLLEKVYLKLAPYVPAKLNLNHFFGKFEPVCPLCGGNHLQSRGSRYTRVSQWQRFQCQECGHWSSAPIHNDGTLGQLR